jgi:catechol 2,3-dioxygenase-like lactoylglutathione lyase family enzyme
MADQRRRETVFVGSIVTNCFEFEAMLNFWRDALDYRLREPLTDDWAILTDPTGRGPNLSFQKRDHKRDRRSWVHLDLYTADQKGEVERLIGIGARRYPWRYPEDADYVVLEDPDGNLFCVVQADNLP